MEHLYYYGNECLLQALWDQRLKLSSPSEFNDPFDFLPATTEVTEESRKYCQTFQRVSANTYYVLCLSHVENNARMWAQYGANHTGLMIAFRRDSEFFALFDKANWLVDVDYTCAKRHIIDPNAITPDDIREILRRKGSDWAHEQECRVVMSESLFQAHPDVGEEVLFHGRATRFLKIEDAWIDSVTLGNRTAPHVLNALESIKRKRTARWSIKKAKLSDHTFALTPQVIVPGGD